jgi:hypothetical protein
VSRQLIIFNCSYGLRLFVCWHSDLLLVPVGGAASSACFGMLERTCTLFAASPMGQTCFVPLQGPLQGCRSCHKPRPYAAV